MSQDQKKKLKSSKLSKNPKDISKNDQWLVRNWKVKSADEIAELTGVEADVVYLRVKEILGSIDEPTIQEWIMSLLIQLQGIVNDAESAALNAEPRLKADLYNASRQAAATLLKPLENMLKQAETNAGAAQARYAMLFVEIIQRSFFTTMKTLKEMHPEIDENVIEATFTRNMTLISSEYDEDAK